MKDKMKKLFVAVFAAVAFAVPSLSAQQNAAAKYVDQDGFAYSCKSGAYLLDWLKDIYVVGTQKLKDNPEFSLYDKIVREFWKECNADQIGMVAASGKEIAPDFITAKSFTAIPAAARTGLLWKLAANSPSVPFVDVMPKHTLVGFGTNLNGAALMGAIDKYVAKYGTQEIQQGYAGIFSQAMQEGVDIRKIMNSLTGIAFYIEADPARQIMPGFSSGALILSVKDRSVMELLLAVAKKENPNIVTANNEILFPTDFGAVAIFQVNHYLVVTTDPAGAKNVISGNAPSLKQNPDFIKYSAGTPSAATGFCFVSSELGKSVLPAYLVQFPEAAEYVDLGALCKVVGIGPAVYSVQYMNQEGVGSVCNTGSKGVALLMVDDGVMSMLTTVLVSGAEYFSDKAEEETVDFVEVEEIQ